MKPLLFDTFHGRLRLEGLLTTRTGLHIGAGGSGELLGTDLPVVRNSAGQPFLPGSSLKGVIRSAAEALLRGAPFAGASGSKRPLWTCELIGGDPCVTEARVKEIREEKSRAAAADDAGRTHREVAEVVWEESCTVCRLFGSLALASRVRFPDLPLAGELPVLELRNGVGIDRDRGLAADKVLYDFEAIPPETPFRLTVVVDNPSDEDVGLLLYLFNELDCGHIALGGKTSRGLGLVRVVWQRIVETTLQKGNPFAEMLSSRDLLSRPAAEEPEEQPEETPAEAGPSLPATGDPQAWKALAELLEELPEIDKTLLGQRGAEHGLTKNNLNDKLGLGLDSSRKAWDTALERLVETGFLVKREDRLYVASQIVSLSEPEEEETQEVTERPPELQAVIDHYVGALARLWEEAC